MTATRRLGKLCATASAFLLSRGHGLVQPHYPPSIEPRHVGLVFFSQQTYIRRSESSVRREVQEHFTQLYSPSFGKLSAASEPSANSKSSLIAFTGSIRKSLDGGALARIYAANYATGDCNMVTQGAGGNTGDDKCPKWSPDGQQLAFLSDRSERDVFQVYVLDETRMAEAIPIGPVPGNVESISWSSDSERLLILAADRGAEQSGAHGGARFDDRDGWLEKAPEWSPSVQFSEKPIGWRRAWSYNLKTEQLERVGETNLNVWEACWMGNDHMLAVVSYDPTENSWYRACLATVDIRTCKHREIYRGAARRQLGCPAASPSGSHVAVIECLSSDRGGVAGDVIMLNTSSSDTQHHRIDLGGVDVTQIIWHTENQFSYIGLRKTSTVAGHFQVTTSSDEKIWDSPLTCGTLYPEATITKEGDFGIIAEGWNEYQKLIVARFSRSDTIKEFEHAGAHWLRSRMGEMKSISWKSTDGLEIQGYLCLRSGPREQRPFILNVHGGPVWTFRNKWQLASPIIPFLVSRGYAVLSANPRGSTGRGQEFCSKVLGDLGGGDAQDLLSGVEAVVQRRDADPSRIGVMGVSYGGYMATWLPTQSSRFSAAVAIAPVTNWCSNHGTANIGYFDKFFFGTSPYRPWGLYHSRSPVMFAGTHPTPFLQITGAEDRCVPPSQSIEYHTALSEAGVKSVLVTYPNEGHGIRQDPAYMDFCTRTVEWFDENLRK